MNDNEHWEIVRNQRLAERLASGGSVPDLDKVMEWVRQMSGAHLDVPGPRAAQLCDEIDRLTAEHEVQLARAIAERDAARAEVEALCARVAGLEEIVQAGLPEVDTTTEWGARFGPVVNVVSESRARAEVLDYGGELVSRRVGPWTVTK